MKLKRLDEKIKMLHSLKMSTLWISEYLSIHKQRVKRRLKKYGLIENKKNRKIGETKRVRNTTAYKTWRLKILERDGYTCQYCGSKENLELDHILPACLYPTLIMSDTNARILCHKCHRKTPTYFMQCS